MLTYDTFRLLRLPFSLFLLPIFLFALIQAPTIAGWPAMLVFILLHFFIYPASNAYNSFQDKDEEAIAGLQHPPMPTRQLYYVSLVLDAVGLLLALCISVAFAAQVALYVLVSKAYSYQGIRLKRYPLLSYLLVSFFQGGFTFLICYEAFTGQGWQMGRELDVQRCMLISTLLVGGMYPLTQVYQHGEDARRGDLTLSRRLGIRGTFIWSALVFAGGFGLLGWYLLLTFQFALLGFLLLAALPIGAYFIYWMLCVWRDAAQANYRHVMRLNWLAGGLLSSAFMAELVRVWLASA